jgi:hypothetical protein
LRSLPFDSVPNSSISMRSGVIVAALSDHERPGLARRVGMDGARGQLLARAGRADDHDAAVGLGADTVDGLAQLAHRRGHADQLEGLAGCAVA